MVDDRGQKGTFDFSLSSAKSGGLVDDSWVHVALSVDSGDARGMQRAGVTVFVDGKELDAISDRRYAVRPHPGLKLNTPP